MASTDDVLMRLKAKLSDIADLLDPAREIIYIDYPLHRNTGDLLINIATEEFFKSHGLKVKRRYNLYDLPHTIPDVEKTDIFVFHGGGNLGDLYPEHLDAVASILEQYPSHQIVQLPQTVFFTSDQQRQLRCDMLKRHGNCSIFVRDRRSLEALQEFDVPNVYLMPDMAHQLYGKLVAKGSRGAESKMYFFRRDEESRGVPPAILSHKDQAVDWDDSIKRPDRLACALLWRLVRLSKRVGYPADVHALWYYFRDNMVKSGVAFLSTPEMIYTNRLHAMLLGLLLGKQVCWFDNTYGKLSGYVETWFGELATVQQVE